MAQQQTHGTDSIGTVAARGGRGGFTLIEVLVAVLILGILAGLLILGIRAARGVARSTVQTVALTGVTKGVESFRSQFGFLPPLVKEQETLPTTPAQLNTALTNVIQLNSANRAVIQTYNAVLDARFLRGLPGGGSAYAGPTADNQFRDNRYSELSLAYYLAGGLEEPYRQGLSDVPMDGVSGPGMYAPTADGTFSVPDAARDATPANRKRVGQVFEPLVEISGNTRLVVEPGPSGASAERARRRVLLTDRNGVAIRYYRWLNGRQYQANGDFEVRGVGDLRPPPLVARFGQVVPDSFANPPAGTPIPAPGADTLRQGLTNPLAVPLEDQQPARAWTDNNLPVKGAGYAIVAAGPDRAFGDEPIAELARILSVPEPTVAGEVLLLRERASRDNIVELGTP